MGYSTINYMYVDTYRGVIWKYMGFSEKSYLARRNKALKISG